MLPGTIREASFECIQTIRDILNGDFRMEVDSWESLSARLVELRIELDADCGIVWVVMQPKARPSFTLQMIRDFLVLFEGIQVLSPVRLEPYRVLAYRSDAPGVFNRGGDLPLFLDCITRRDEDLLRLYAQGCAMMSFRNRNFPMAPLVTIALIQGEAMGGGFEAALSCDLVFAEERAMFGFPEVLFGLFPGMGAVTYLTRRVGAREAERLIVDGKHFKARSMAEIGAVDGLVSNETGLEDLRCFVKRKLRRYNAWSGFHRSRRLSDPVSFAELSGIADIWVDRSMTLKASRVPRMKELIRKQDADGLRSPAMLEEAGDLLMAS